MMRSRRSLKNLARTGCKLLLIASLLSGCSSSTSPTYLKENVAGSIQSICANEYNVNIKVKLTNETLWIYFPVENLLSKADKPEKYTEKFEIEQNSVNFVNDSFALEYAVREIPEVEKTQEYTFNKEVQEKTNNIWKALRRVLFSMEHKENGQPKFFVLVTADITNGIESREIFYILDMKKVSYEYISWSEYQHRSINSTDIAPQAVGDTEGSYIDYREITMDEFIAMQIQHRIKLKFQRPEVEKNADIDKEVLKIAVHTINIYGIKDFNELELNNLASNNRSVLNRAAVLGRPID